jgi:hypothetical protein
MCKLFEFLFDRVVNPETLDPVLLQEIEWYERKKCVRREQADRLEINAFYIDNKWN